MKLTESMLRDWVNTPLSVQEIGDLLTMTGFELESIDEVEGEAVLDVNIMANRGDGASVLGLAREILAKSPESSGTELYLRAVERFPAADVGARDIWSRATVLVESENCTRFACRVFEGLTNGDSPDWIQERLRQVGQRPISLLVDLTNYVMLETGQPLHAYDLDLLEGQRIIVRQAIDGEPLTTLDGRKHSLHPNNLVICDAVKPVGIAGVMGGSETEVSGATTRCLLESAHFVNTSVRRTRKQLGLFTEASYRFERHVDPEGVVAALNRFAELLVEIQGRKPVGGVIDVRPSAPDAKEVHLRMDRCDRILGMEVNPDIAKGYLERLGFSVNPVGPRKFDVGVPTWRIDIQREDDLVEEVGRVHGYQHIPERLPIGSTPMGGTTGVDALVDRLTEAALRVGLDETVSHTLGDVHPLDAATEHVQVREPHSPETARLRNSLLPNLAITASRYGGKDFAFFEVGHVFAPEKEVRSFAAVVAGARSRPSWRPQNTTPADFFSLKGQLEEILRGFELSFQPASDPRFHPGRVATVVADKREVGLIGQLHPDTAEASDLPLTTYAIELDLEALAECRPAQIEFRTITRNPAVRRDVSVSIAANLPFEKIERSIETSAIPLLEKWWLFDRYVGPGLEDGTHSLSFGLSIRKPGANLTDDEANQVRDRFIEVLTQQGAKLR